MAAIPAGLADWKLALKNGGSELEYTFDAAEERTGIPALLRRLSELGIGFTDLQTRQSSLEDIFVDLVSESSHEPPRRRSRSTASRWRASGARCGRAW